MRPRPTSAKHAAWLLVLAFVVGGGESRLVGHLVCPTPPRWMKLAVHQHTEWLLNAGQLFGVALETADQRLTTAIVRSTTTTQLERVARSVSNTKQQTAWSDKVAAGPRVKPIGRRDEGDLRRATVARRYLELHRSSSTPKADLARELQLAPNTVNSLLYQSRERGLLTSVGRGRAGGALTERAIELLTQPTTEGTPT